MKLFNRILHVVSYKAIVFFLNCFNMKPSIPTSCLIGTIGCRLSADAPRRLRLPLPRYPHPDVRRRLQLRANSVLSLSLHNPHLYTQTHHGQKAKTQRNVAAGCSHGPSERFLPRRADAQSRPHIRQNGYKMLGQRRATTHHRVPKSLSTTHREKAVAYA